MLKGSSTERSWGLRRILRSQAGAASKRRKEIIAILFASVMLLGVLIPLSTGQNDSSTTAPVLEDVLPISPAYTPSQSEDFALGAQSANLTVQKSGSVITVFAEEYKINVDYSTPYVNYTIHPYFTTDFIRYRRVNPQGTGGGTIDQNENDLNVLSMTISKYGKTSNTVWFKESCPEFSLNQSFVIYRDYFELNVTYQPGTKNVLTTYFIALYDKNNAFQSLFKDGKVGRYVPGFDEDNPREYGMGGWYPRTSFYAPACDLRKPGGNLGVEWGYNETVAYLYSPIWMKDMGGGGPSTFALKYSSINSIVPNIALGTSKTFHMFVRPYKSSDGADRGYDVGYAQWVAPRVASYWGNHNTPVFPLTVMNIGSWSTSFRTWVENSQVKVATYSTNANQINWNYKSAGLPYMEVNTPSAVPKSWQIYKAVGTPLTDSNGNVECNPVNGPYSTKGTYRWQLIQNDSSPTWWYSSKGVFWDGLDPINSMNNPLQDYQNRNEFIYDGYLRLVSDSYASGHWKYVIANGWSATLHLSIVADISIVENFEPSSSSGSDFAGHVTSTMNFVNNIPTKYRPKILVYQNYAATKAADQEHVYSALFNSAKYKFNIELLDYGSYDAQIHNLVMAEAMFKAMGCTRDSDTRIDVGTIDLRESLSLTTSAKMIVTLGNGKPTITSTTDQGGYIFTNLNASSKSFDISIPTSYYYSAGTNARVASPITYSIDGRAMFHGIVDAERTGQIVKNSNVQITQQTAGTASVNVVSLGNGQAQLTVAATGGTTTIKLKGFTVGSSYDIIVNSVTVEKKTAALDGSVTFTRTFGASDSVQVKATSVSEASPPSTPVDQTPVNQSSMPYGPSSVPIPDGIIIPMTSEDVGLVQQSDASAFVALAAIAAPASRQGRILLEQG